MGFPGHPPVVSDIMLGMRIRVTRSARKHRIGNAHILAAMANAGTPTAGPGDQLIYIGTDDRGLALLIIAVPDDRHPDTIAVIHATPLHWRRP